MDTSFDSLRSRRQAPQVAPDRRVVEINAFFGTLKPCPSTKSFTQALIPKTELDPGLPLD